MKLLILAAAGLPLLTAVTAITALAAAYKNEDKLMQRHREQVEGE